MGRVIGIDLGTTNSVAAVLEGGEPLVIESAEGGRTVPSVVAFAKNGEILVGDTARRQKALNPKNTVSSVKRFMGRTVGEVQDEIGQMPYKVVAGTDDRASIEIGDKTYTPQEISAKVLMKLKADVEAKLGEPVTDAVITVPAYFNDAQRNATKEAGRIAGLNVLRIVNEPTAAALAYGLGKAEDKQILVFDLGGGTFDVSILDIEDGVFQVKSTSGDTHLGGDDYDRRVVDWVADAFKKENGVDLRKDPQSLARLIEAAEKAKIDLSGRGSTDIKIPFITVKVENGEQTPLHVDVTLSRAEFERITKDLTERCRGPIQQALDDAGLKPADIAEVLMVGGSTRMPAVQDLVKQMLGEKKMNRTVNPDEVVAAGAAVQGGVLTEEISDVLLLDVTPLSLGIETAGGVNTILIPRNTTVPTSAIDEETQGPPIFTTYRDNQPTVEVKLLQGERPLAKDCRLLGKFELKDIPPAKKGVPQIEVRLDIDADGIVTVSARDLAFPNKEAVKLVISDATSLDEKDIARMVQEAEAHSADDRQRVEAIEARNRAERLIDSTNEAVTKWGDQISPELKADLEAQSKQLAAALKTNDDAKVVQTVRSLEESITKIGDEVNARGGVVAPDAAPAADADAPPPASGPVIGDADPFEGLG